MGEVEKKLKGISRMLMVLVIAAIIIIAAVVGAYWWFYLRSGRVPGVSLKVSPAPTGVEKTGGYAKPGENVTISGSTNPAIADATVTLNYTKPDASGFNRTTTSGSDGKFSDKWTVEEDYPTGKWTVMAEISGNVSDPVEFYIFLGETKIGVIGPMEWAQGKGHLKGAILAAEEIGDAGGILGHKIVVYHEDDGGEDPVIAKAAAERLAPKVDFMMGGFRTECMYPIREVAMNNKKIFMICGSATTELTNCYLTAAWGQGRCGACVRCDYDRYKYLFRVTPPNGSALFKQMLVPYMKYYVIPEIMVPKFGKPVKVAVICEKAAWTALLRMLIEEAGSWFFALESPWNPYDRTAEIVYENYPLPTDTDFSVQLQAIEDLGVNFVIHVFSAKAGQIFISQWGERQINALCMGVDVLGQESDHWDITEGKCNYECFSSTPPRFNVTDKVIPFWDTYFARFGSDPAYTAFGTYDAMYILKTAIERAGTFDPDAYPETDYVPDCQSPFNPIERTRGRLIVELEKIDMEVVMGQFKFTTWHDPFMAPTKDPPGTEASWLKVGDPSPYDGHPLTQEELREIPVEDIVVIKWTTTTRMVPIMVQWQNGEKAIVFPLNQTYTKDIIFPPWISP